MANDNPDGTNTNGGDGNEPPTEQHPIATAIKALERQYQSARENPTKNERQSHFWSVWTGRGVLIYTFFTAAIMVASICAAIYSRRQAETAEKMFISTQRAYMYFAGVNTRKTQDPNSKEYIFYIGPMIGNSGNTSTKNSLGAHQLLGR